MRMVGNPPFYMLGVSLMSNATDAELAKILRSRGYVVTKKKKGKGRK